MTPLEAACEHVKRGFKVLPLHGVRDGACTCAEKRDCRTPGKHPRVSDWTKRATGDFAQIEKWFGRDHGLVNLGIATGARSGVFVLDIDPRHGGEESLR